MIEQPTVEKVKEPCHVANSGCQNPAGWRMGAGINTNNTWWMIEIPLCFRCGYPVCDGENCSAVVEYAGEHRRLCAACLGEMAEEQAI